MNPTEPKQSRQVDDLSVEIHHTLDAMAEAAAQEAHRHLRTVLSQQEQASVIMASAASQVKFLEVLTGLDGIDWSRVTLFHMDEYLGIGPDHPASFRRFLREQVAQRVHPRAFHEIRGEADLPLDECRRYAGLLEAQPIDLCCLGIGENGHIAFNDPPVANFEDPDPIKLVKLDEACRMQQVGEGAFSALDAVPRYAYTLSVPALCAARRMVCVVPERRKAKAVQATLQGPIATACPASFLRRQKHATLYLDSDSASRL